MFRFVFLVVFFWACSPEESEPIDTGEKVGCGDPTAHDVTLYFAVEDTESNGVSNLLVSLVDRSWEPGVLGESETDGQGLGSLLAVGVTDLPNCWGTVLNYVVEVKDSNGYYADAEKPINSYLHGAIEDGTFEADFSAFPIVVSPQ